MLLLFSFFWCSILPLYASNFPSILFAYTSIRFDDDLYHNYFGNHGGDYAANVENICNRLLVRKPPKLEHDYVFFYYPVFVNVNIFKEFLIACSKPPDDATAVSGSTAHAIWENDNGVNMMFEVLLTHFLSNHLLFDYSLEPMMEPETHCVDSSGYRTKHIFNQDICMRFHSAQHVNEDYSENKAFGNLNPLNVAFLPLANERFAHFYNELCQLKSFNTNFSDCISIIDIYPYQYHSFCCCSWAPSCNDLINKNLIDCAFVQSAFISTTRNIDNQLRGSACLTKISIDNSVSPPILHTNLKATFGSECPQNGDFCTNSELSCSIVSLAESMYETNAIPSTKITCCCKYNMCNLKLFEQLSHQIKLPKDDDSTFELTETTAPCAYGDFVTPYTAEGVTRCLVAYDVVRQKVITGGLIGRFRNVTKGISFWDMKEVKLLFPVEIIAADSPTCKEKVYSQSDVGNGALLYFESCYASIKQCDTTLAMDIAQIWAVKHHRFSKSHECDVLKAQKFEYNRINNALNSSIYNKSSLSWGCSIKIERKPDFFILTASPAVSMINCLNVKPTVTSDVTECCVLLDGISPRNNCTIEKMVKLYATPFNDTTEIQKRKSTRCLSSFFHSDNAKYSDCEMPYGCVGIDPLTPGYDNHEDCVSDLEALVIEYPAKNYTIGAMMCQTYRSDATCAYTYTFTKKIAVLAVVCCCPDNECNPWISSTVDDINTETKRGLKISTFEDTVK